MWLAFPSENKRYRLALDARGETGTGGGEFTPRIMLVSRGAGVNRGTLPINCPSKRSPSLFHGGDHCARFALAGEYSVRVVLRCNSLIRD